MEGQSCANNIGVSGLLHISDNCNNISYNEQMYHTATRPLQITIKDHPGPEHCNPRRAHPTSFTAEA